MYIHICMYIYAYADVYANVRFIHGHTKLVWYFQTFLDDNVVAGDGSKCAFQIVRSDSICVNTALVNQ